MPWTTDDLPGPLPICDVKETTVVHDCTNGTQGSVMFPDGAQPGDVKKCPHCLRRFRLQRS